MNSDMDKFFKEAEEWAIEHKIMAPIQKLKDQLASGDDVDFDAIEKEAIELGIMIKKCTDDLEALQNSIENNKESL